MMQHSTQGFSQIKKNMLMVGGAFMALVAVVACLGFGVTERAYADPTAAEKQAEAESVLASITAMQETLDVLSAEYFEALAAQEEAETNRDAAKARLTEINHQLEDIQNRLSERAREMYRNGGVSFIEILLDTSSFEEFATSWDMLNRVNENDAIMAQMRKELAAEAEEQANIYNEQAEVASEKAEEAAQAEAQAEATIAEMQATYESLSAEAAQLLEEERKAREAEEAARAAAVLAEAAAAAQREAAAANSNGSNTAAPSGGNAATPSGDSGTTPSGGDSGTTPSGDDSGTTAPSGDDSGAQPTPSEEAATENTGDDSGSSDDSGESSGGSYEGGSDTVSRAYACLGAPYVWGGVGPDGYDCSGLVSYCLSGSHTRLGTTYTFMGWPMVSDPQPGDIAVNYSHTGVYIGDGQMIHAATYGVGVIIGPVQSGMIFVRYGG